MMSRDKSVRRASKGNNARNIHETNSQDSEHSFENESVDLPQSTSNLPVRKRAISGSSTGHSSRRGKSKPSDESENEAIASDATYTKDDSGSNQNNVEALVDPVRKVENFLMSDYPMNNEKRDSESPDNSRATRRERRRKSKKQRREKNRTFNIKRIDDDETYEDGRPLERDLSRARIKSRANISRKSKRRKRRSKGESSGITEKQEEELPITEILRKAQENPRMRHEEPLPLAELTTDKIYVQGRNGFSAFKISANRSSGFFSGRDPQSKESVIPLYPIKVAIVAQKIWHRSGFIHQGLLAGMALMHLIFIQTYFRFSFDFLVDYSVVSELYSNTFAYLVTVCVISVFDRFDLARLNIDHLREIYAEHIRSFLAIPLYIATFCLHQTSIRIGEDISLLRYGRNTTEIENNYTSIIVEEDLHIWQKVTLAKDSLAVFAWLFVALGPHEDMLLNYLRGMEKYVEPPVTSGEH